MPDDVWPRPDMARAPFLGNFAARLLDMMDLVTNEDRAETFAILGAMAENVFRDIDDVGEREACAFLFCFMLMRRLGFDYDGNE